MLPKDTRIGLLAPITWPIPPAAYGAWERVVTNLANGLVAADYQNVTLFATKQANLNGVHTVAFVDNPLGEQNLAGSRALEFVHIAKSLQQAAELDIIHNHLNYHPLLFSDWIRTPMVTTMHGSAIERKASAVTVCTATLRLFQSQILKEYFAPDQIMLPRSMNGIDFNTIQLECTRNELESKWRETWFPGARDPPSMVETWEHLRSVPMFYHVRRIPMDALDVEMSIAEGEQALQALLQFVREQAGTLEAHEAEKGIFKRLLPIGLAAMKLYFAQRGTGDVGPAVTRADGVILPREKPLRGRDYFSLFGKFAVARTCYRTPGEPGIFPLDAQVNLPERCYSYFLQEWMTLFEVEHPFKESAGWFEQLFDLDVAESVLMEVAKEAPAGL